MQKYLDNFATFFKNGFDPSPLLNNVKEMHNWYWAAPPTPSSCYSNDWLHVKHCQRQNGPEGWVLLTKITSFVISKFLHKFWSNFISRISTKHQLQNLNQISAFRLNLSFIILTKPSFRISTNIKLHNLNHASASRLNLKIKILTKPSLRNSTKI